MGQWMKAKISLWQKPELTVLARSRPEEAVLAACKGGNGIRGKNTTTCIQPGQAGNCNGLATS
jgi:hypothetical protein